jgi:hypothetical protein
MLSAKMPIYCAMAPVDLRRSFDGLAAASKEVPIWSALSSDLPLAVGP